MSLFPTLNAFAIIFVIFRKKIFVCLRGRYDIIVCVFFNIVVNTMLQNALPSDDDEKDPNDPHKALDIDLDK